MLSLAPMAAGYVPMTMPSGTQPSVHMSAENFAKFVDSNVADTTLEKPWTSGEISDKAGLVALAKKLNPVVGYWGARVPHKRGGLGGQASPGLFRSGRARPFERQTMCEHLACSRAAGV